MASRRGWAVVPIGAALLGVLVALVLGATWRIDGGRWFTVTTPSMGEALPVGTLFVTSPTSVAETQPGDVVTFRNPQNGVVYTHRVVGKDATGLETQGDANDVPDAWRITDRQLIGQVVWHADGFGWLVRALPLLLLGFVLVWLATRWKRAGTRWPWRILGGSVVVALVNWWLHPWVGLERLGQSPPPDGGDGIVVDVVSTGLLPIRAAEWQGPAEVGLHNGQVGSLHLTAGADRGAFDVHSVIDLPWWGWLVAAGCALSPLLVVLAIGLPTPAQPPVDTDADSGADGEIDLDRVLEPGRVS